MISLADILKTQRFTNLPTQKLGYNIIEIKIQNILLAIRQVNSYTAAILKIWSRDPKGPHDPFRRCTGLLS